MHDLLIVAGVVTGYLFMTCFAVAGLMRYGKHLDNLQDEEGLCWLFGLIWPLSITVGVVLGVCYLAYVFVLNPVMLAMVRFVGWLTTERKPEPKLPKMEVRK